MKNIYKYSLISIIIMISFTVYVGFDYQSYLKNVNDLNSQLLVIPSSDISVNYELGNEIVYTDDVVVKKFTVTNINDQDIAWNINLVNNTEVDELNTANIEIKEGDSTILSQDVVLDSFNEIMSNITLPNNTTKEYTMTISCNETDVLGKIHINLSDEYVNSFSNAIKNNNLTKHVSSIAGEVISATNEGLLQDESGIYYFRGAVDNNYVSFANYKWRVLSLDGSNVKLILDEEISSLNSKYSIQNTEFSLSDAYTVLNVWYSENLSSYDDYLDEMVIISEDTITDNKYQSTIRFNNNELSFNNIGIESRSKIGLITMDEIIYAGGHLTLANDEFYLAGNSNINSIYTSSLSHNSGNNIYMYTFNTNTGKVGSTSIAAVNNLRPVITLNNKVLFTGDGTLDSPYTIN